MTNKFQIPGHWLLLQIGEVADVVAGGTPKAGDPDNFAEPGTEIAWLTPADLSKYAEKYISYGARDLSPHGYKKSSAKILPAGTLLFSSRAPIGYIAIAKNEVSTNQGFKNFVLPAGIDSSYGYYFLRSIRSVAESMGTGTTFKEISGANAKKLPFILAPYAEQKVIADKLDALLAQIETTKARLERIPQILKRFRQSVLAAAVSGRLTEEWRKDHVFEYVSVAEIKQCHSDYALAKANRYLEPARFEESNAAYQIPESWKWFRAEELCDLITKGTTPKKSDMSGNGYVPFIKVYNLTFDGTLDFSIEPTFISKEIHENALRRSKVYPGDVLMNIVGPPLGKVSIVPDTFPEWNLNQAISIFRPVCGVTPGYFALCLRDTTLLEQTKSKAKATAGQFNLTLAICRDYAIPVPPLKEQTQIVHRVNQLFTHADRIEQQVQAALERVNLLTQSILAKTFRGELTEQWRKDNPELISGENSAAALLERIKTERAAMQPAKKGRRTKVSS